MDILASSVSVGGSAAKTSNTVADRLAETLRAYGVRFAFGIPGNDVLELVRACEEQGIEFILAKNEPAAAFMADAVYQTTGVPAVLIVALGPGLSNAMSGIAGAAQERSAILVLAGNVAGPLQGVYNHQVFDQIDMARPVVKLVAKLNPDRVSQQVARALDIAMAHPAGPVLLDCLVDETRRVAYGEGVVHRPLPSLRTALGVDDLAAARELIERAERPLLLIGREALHERAVEPLRRFAAQSQLPFLSTYKAKEIIPETSPLCVGSVGLSPVVDAEMLEVIRAGDLLVLAGFDPIELRDGWLDAWSAKKSVLSIDWAPQTHRIFHVGLQAIGDLPSIIDQLAVPRRTSSWTDTNTLRDVRGKVCQIVRPRQPDNAISPAALFAVVNEQRTEEWILTIDVGAHRILGNHVIECLAPGQLLQSNGLGCMGYALPAAIGAQLAHTDRPVVAMIGDGCLLMTLGEIAVAKERNLPLVIIVLNNSTLALIKLKQSKMQMTGRGVDFGAQRFDRIAEGFGAAGIRVTQIPAFAAALKHAVTQRTLTVIDAVVDPSEYWDQM